MEGNLNSLLVFPQMMIKASNQKPWQHLMAPVNETESVDSISTATTQNVSDIIGPHEFIYWFTRRNELVGRYVFDMVKFNSDGPEQWHAMKNVDIGDLSQWALERYERDRETCPQMTVEEIEDEMGVKRDWNYGNRPEWDWLLADMRNTSAHVKLPHAYDMKEIQRSAMEEIQRSLKAGTNILSELKKSMRLADKDIARNCEIGSTCTEEDERVNVDNLESGKVSAIKQITDQPVSKQQKQRSVNGGHDRKCHGVNRGRKRLGDRIRRVFQGPLRILRSLI